MLDSTILCWMQIEDNAEPMAKEFNEQQLQPAAEYIAKNFEREARRLAREVGPLAVGLPKAMRRAVQLNKVCLPHSIMKGVQPNLLVPRQAHASASAKAHKSCTSVEEVGGQSVYSGVSTHHTHL